ncbi:Choline/ethanolamine kinase [seawater metagenome]|uniref:Choline/ethanolamine kinase n=1 Tax=seawater metagenome TaxID=1561972 RepID=A0A5E8CIW0_9ZZZZ
MDDIKVLFENKVTKLDSIKKMIGGLSNNMFLINETYVWRVFQNKLSNPNHEIYVMENLPYYEIYYYDSNNICYKFIEGVKKDYENYNKSIKLVIDKMIEINKLGLQSPHFWTCKVPSWFKLLKEEQKKSVEVIYQKINKLLIFDEKDNVFCHNDLIIGNVIFFEEKIFIIDWEFSGINYYYYEIGNLICEYFSNYDIQTYEFDKIDDNIIQVFLGYYKKETSSENIAKVKVGILMSHFVWYLYSLIMKENPIDDSFDYLRFGLERLIQLKKYLK